jgi:hypothetical protein
VQNAFYAGSFFAIGENSDDDQESADEDRQAETAMVGQPTLPSITAPFSGEYGFIALHIPTWARNGLNVDI